MAVAFDAATASVRNGDTTDPWTFSHPPVGTPRGVVLLISQKPATASDIDTITYGSASMSRVGSVYSDTAGETGTSEIWFVGSSIPTGTQTVTINFVTTSPTDDYLFTCCTVTASADTEVIDSDGISENAANPSVTLSYSGKTAIAFATAFIGGADPANLAWNANMTGLGTADFGARAATSARQTTPGTADFDAGGTMSTDDLAFAAVAISEVVSGGATVTPTVGAAAFVGVAAALLVNHICTPGVVALAISSDAPSAEITHNKLVPAVAVAFTPTTPDPIVANIRAPPVGELALSAAAPSAEIDHFKTNATVSLAIASDAVSVLVGNNVQPDAGAATLTGIAPASILAEVELPPAGSLTLTGIAPSAEIAHNRQAAVGSIAFTGIAPSLLLAEIVSPPVGSLVLSGLTPSAEIDHFKTNATVSLAIASDAVSVLVGNNVQPSAGSATLTGIAPDPLLAEFELPTSGALSLTGIAPSAEIAHNRQTAAGSISLTGIAPSLLLAEIVSPSVGSVTLTGAAPSAEIDHFKQTSAGSLSLGSDAPSIFVGFLIQPPVGSLTLSGASATVDFTVSPSAGGLSLTGELPVIPQPVTVGSISFTGYSVELNIANAGTDISNATATNEPNNYESCDITGFRVKRGGLIEQFNGRMVRPESYSPRHPQEFVRSTSDRQTGPQRPEQDDTFVSIITVDDL